MSSPKRDQAPQKHHNSKLCVSFGQMLPYHSQIYVGRSIENQGLLRGKSMYSLRSSFEKRGREFLRVEGAQILNSLANPDPFHWHGELALDADDYAAFGGTVELG